MIRLVIGQEGLAFYIFYQTSFLLSLVVKTEAFEDRLASCFSLISNGTLTFALGATYVFLFVPVDVAELLRRPRRAPATDRRCADGIAALRGRQPCFAPEAVWVAVRTAPSAA